MTDETFSYEEYKTSKDLKEPKDSDVTSYAKFKTSAAQSQPDVMNYGQYKELNKMEQADKLEAAFPQSVEGEPEIESELRPIESDSLFERMINLNKSDRLNAEVLGFEETKKTLKPQQEIQPTETAADFKPLTNFDPELMPKVRAMNYEDYLRGAKIRTGKLGLLETPITVGTGAFGFLTGMAASAGVGAIEALNQGVREGRFTKQDAVDVLSKMNQIKDIIANELTYQPRHYEGQKAAELAVAPFTFMHNKVDEIFAESPEDVKQAAHYVADAIIVAGPKLARETVKLARKGRAKLIENKQLTPEEIKALNELGQDWRNIEIVERVNSIAEETKVAQQLKEAFEKNQAKKVNKAIKEVEAKPGRKSEAAKSVDKIIDYDAEPTPKDLAVEERLLMQDAERWNKDQGIERLKNLHREWKAKRDLAVNDFSDEIGIEQQVKRDIAKAKKLELETSLSEGGKTVGEVVDMLAEGNKAAIEEIKSGIETHGVSAVEDAIRNKSMLKIAKTEKGQAREAVKKNITELEKDITPLYETKAPTEISEGSVTLNDRVTSNILYADRAAAFGRKELYSDPIAQKRIDTDPEYALNKLINDVNLYTHGDETVNINNTRYALHTLRDQADVLRSYFIGDEEFEYFKTQAEAGLEFARIASKDIGGTVEKNITLSSGFDPSKMTDEAKQAFKYVENVRKEKGVESLKRKLVGDSDRIAEKWWDVTGKAKRFLDEQNTNIAYDAYKQLALKQGAQTAASIHIANMRKAVYKGLSRLDRKLTNDIIFFRRIIAIDKARAEEVIRTGKKYRKVKHPKISKEAMKRMGLTGEPVELDAVVAKSALENLENQIGKDHFNELNARAEVGFQVMRDMLRLLKDEGLISEKTYDILKDIDYMKRQDILDAIDPEHEYTIGKTKLSVRESGVTGLKTGRFDDRLELDSELLMAQVIQSAYGRIFRNRTNKVLYEMAVKTPDNGLVKIGERKPDGKLPIPPRGWSSVDLFIDGKKNRMLLQNEFAKSWIAGNREISFDLAKFNQLISGSAFLKPTATGANPEFAMMNLLRDTMHIYLTNQMKVGDKWVSAYSSHLPIYLAQLGSDITSVAGDVILRKGRYQDAVFDGMLMKFLAHEGRVFRKHEIIQSPIDAIMETLGYITESGEVLSRLALRERAMKVKASQLGISLKEFREANEKLRPSFENGRLKTNPQAKTVPKDLAAKVDAIRKEGSFVARDYMDFSNHGTHGEFVDTLIPYFNAGIQGTRGIFRSFRRNKTEFATKVGWLAVAAGTLYMRNLTQYGGKELDKIPDYVRENNFVILTDIEITDDKNQRRRVYWKIPKDPGQKYFSILSEAIIAKMTGNEADIPGLKKAFNSFSPIESAVPSIPTLEMALGATTNFDLQRSMWQGKNIPVWSGPETQEGNHAEEYVTGRGALDTPRWAIGLGQMFDKSPTHIEHAVNSYFAHNVLTDIAGGAADKMFGPDKQWEKEMLVADSLSKVEKIVKTPFLRKFVGLTNPEEAGVREAEHDIVSEASLDRFIVRRQLDVKLINTLVNKTEKFSELYKFMAENPKYEDMIKDGIDFGITLKRLSDNDRSFWIRMRGPYRNETKAKMYYSHWLSKDSKEERAKLDSYAYQFGFDSMEFFIEVSKLKAIGRSQSK